ncbi:MAG: hypothetical protein HC831_14080 [Chloroflexia bacterium]|nr:hypothetical protein [Chloroflexia bacterium]
MKMLNVELRDGSDVLINPQTIIYMVKAEDFGATIYLVDGKVLETAVNMFDVRSAIEEC